MKFLLPIALFGLAEAILIPSLDGPFSTALRVQSLTDHNRMDPYAPKKNTLRRILTSTFWPISHDSVCGNETIQYMPPATAASYGPLAESAGLPNDTFSAFEISFCKLSGVVGCKSERTTRKSSRHPLVIFSPGLGESRLLYSNMAKSLAGQGYVVITVDHPYDTQVVEFPDGSVVQGGNISDDDSAMEQAIQVSPQQSLRLAFHTDITRSGPPILSFSCRSYENPAQLLLFLRDYRARLTLLKSSQWATPSAELQLQRL